MSAICGSEGWQCPSGFVDASMCPSGCAPGARPSPECECYEGEWICPGTDCPAEINPFDPDDPGNRCTPEGATCSTGNGACSGGLSCTCESGSWNCLRYERDSSCWCGREPELGSQCNGEAPTCGQCCPTAAGPNWPAMDCVDGQWQAGTCLEVVCPPVVLECPVEPESAIGEGCGFEGQACGNPCCGTAIDCTDGRWRRGPEAGCACAEPNECGGGACNPDQSCNQRCGPDDGIEYYCAALPGDCRDCSCIALGFGEMCEMVDGYPHVRTDLECG